MFISVISLPRTDSEDSKLFSTFSSNLMSWEFKGTPPKKSTSKAIPPRNSRPYFEGWENHHHGIGWGGALQFPWLWARTQTQRAKLSCKDIVFFVLVPSPCLQKILQTQTFWVSNVVSLGVEILVSRSGQNLEVVRTGWGVTFRTLALSMWSAALLLHTFAIFTCCWQSGELAVFQDIQDSL